MTVESNDAIAIATLSDCIKVSRQLKSKSKTNRAWCARFFPRLQVAGNSDWFNASFTPNVIGELKDLTTATSTTPPQINDLIG